MKNIQVTTSPGVPPRSMEEEFLPHKKGSEWWYSTGYLEDETGRMFGFQFTLAHISFYGVKIHVLLTSLTDFKNGKHYFEQGIDFLGRNIILTPTRTAFGDRGGNCLQSEPGGQQGTYAAQADFIRMIERRLEGNDF